MSLSYGNRWTIKTKELLSVILYFALFWGIVHDMLSLPGALVFITDFMLVSTGVLYLVKGAKLSRRTSLSAFIGIYFIYLLSAYILNFQSIFYFLFGFRHSFRYYIFFLLCINLFKGKDVDSFWNLLTKLFYINAVIMIVQYYILGYSQDFLGGIFGTAQGCNGGLNIFLVVIISRTLVRGFMKLEKTSICVLHCIICFYLSALSELKAFYVEFLIILLICFLITDFSARKLYIAVGAVFALLVGVALLEKLFPMFAGFFSYGEIMRIMSHSGYSSADSVNRLTFINYFNRTVMDTPIKQFLGLGLGNCEISSIAIFNTPFAEMYGWMKYHWLSAPTIYLEQGLIGLIFYFLFFVLVIISAFKLMKRKFIEYEMFCFVTVLASMCCVLSIYNSSMRTEAGYIVYFALSTPFIVSKQARKVNS